MVPQASGHVSPDAVEEVGPVEVQDGGGFSVQGPVRSWVEPWTSSARARAAPFSIPYSWAVGLAASFATLSEITLVYTLRYSVST